MYVCMYATPCFLWTTNAHVQRNNQNNDHNYYRFCISGMEWRRLHLKSPQQKQQSNLYPIIFIIWKANNFIIQKKEHIDRKLLCICRGNDKNHLSSTGLAWNVDGIIPRCCCYFVQAILPVHHAFNCDCLCSISGCLPCFLLCCVAVALKWSFSMQSARVCDTWTAFIAFLNMT